MEEGEEINLEQDIDIDKIPIGISIGNTEKKQDGKNTYYVSTKKKKFLLLNSFKF